jgi:ectoine hydroxylase-related dioxygenase (phytanoyl-CoA dioxygenase family)
VPPDAPDAPDQSTLTRAAEQFWRDGACVVRDVVDSPTLDAMRAAVDRLAGTDDLADLSAIAGDSSTARFRGGVDHWRTDATFAAFSTTGAMPAVAAAVLGAVHLWLYEDSVLVKDPGSPVSTRWHTDDGYFHVEGRQMATVWLALDPSPRRAGALRFIRGSHLDEHRYRPTLFVTDDPIPGTEGDLPPQVDFDDPNVFGFDLEPGDLTIHHARTLHAAGGNAGSTPRRALSVRYCGDDTIVRVKPGAPGKPGFEGVAPGTPLAEVAGSLGLLEAEVGR